MIRFQVPAPEGGAWGTPFLALSPDGRKLAFLASDKGNQRPLLWSRALDSLEARELPGTEGALFPFWSPDSRYIAFAASGKLKKIEASGGPAQVLFDVPSALAVSGFWNHDGVIYFNRGPEGIFQVPQAGGEPVRVAEPDTVHGESTLLYPPKKLTVTEHEGWWVTVSDNEKWMLLEYLPPDVYRQTVNHLSERFHVPRVWFDEPLKAPGEEERSKPN